MMQRKKRNTSKVNLAISIIFHSALIGLVFFFAARQGLVGKRMQALTATLVPKEKKPEPPKEKPPEPKVEPPKAAEAAKPVLAPPKVETAARPADAPPAVAPAAVSLPAFQFNDGAHDVQSVSDPLEIYKALVEHALRSHWNRPDTMDDSAFTAEVELNIDSKGRVLGHRFVSGSGNAVWDDSVKNAVALMPAISQAPPKGFPAKFVVRFDVTTVTDENPLQISAR